MVSESLHPCKDSEMPRNLVVLMDGSNFFLSMKRAGRKVYPPDIVPELIRDLDLDFNPAYKIHFFTSVDRENPSQQRFLNSLALKGFIVHDYDLKCYRETQKCPDCDMNCQAAEGI